MITPFVAGDFMKAKPCCLTVRLVSQPFQVSKTVYLRGPHFLGQQMGALQRN